MTIIGNIEPGSSIGLLNLNNLIHPQAVVFASLAELKDIQSAYYI